MGLAEEMAKFMFEVNARGALMVADNPATERLAPKFGLERVTSKVFIWKPNPNAKHRASMQRLKRIVDNKMRDYGEGKRPYPHHPCQ